MTDDLFSKDINQYFNETCLSNDTVFNFGHRVFVKVEIEHSVRENKTTFSQVYNTYNAKV